MDVELSLREMQKAWHGSFKSYMIGFISSLVLTSLAFFIVYYEFMTHPEIYYTLGALALGQAIVQLIYFLNLTKAEKPNWELFVLLFMILIMLIIVGGSLWIMHDIDQRAMQFHKEHTVKE
ncbi:MAG: cytochrome o ubiquinol oxidase subunit IV [Chlamydiota bacterium]